MLKVKKVNYKKGAITMNKKALVSLGLMAALSVATVSAFAESTIYTDGIGRLHFLGRDAANNTGAEYNYRNSAEQDLTRKLYERTEDGMINDTSYDQHPLKNYENTFPDSRFGTAKIWRTKYGKSDSDAMIKTSDTVRGTATATKGAMDASNPYAYGNTNIDSSYDKASKETTKAKKKHWWNRK